MHKQTIGARAHKARSVWVLIAGLGIATGGMVTGAGAWAQASTPAAAAAAGDAPSEAARRAASSPYRFILLNANAPSRKPTPAAAPEAKVEPKRPAPAPAEHAAVQPRGAPVTAAPAAVPTVVPAPQPVAALAPKPPEPPPVAAVRREIIPIRTDEPRLPAALMRERPSGVVKVAFDVMPDGSTGAVKVVASTNRDLNRASVDAVSRWKFQPVDEVLTVETELAYKYE
jgi:TonB family protein